MKIFFLFLCSAAWQDARRQKIKRGLFWVFGILGIVGCVTSWRDLASTAASAAVGGGILLLSRITEGGIGEGDGWFFVISGLYLSLLDNLFLFLSGLFLSALSGLVILAAAFVRQTPIRGKRMAFLPFLIPGGIWLAFL